MFNIYDLLDNNLHIATHSALSTALDETNVLILSTVFDDEPVADEEFGFSINFTRKGNSHFVALNDTVLYEIREVK